MRERVADRTYGSGAQLESRGGGLGVAGDLCHEAAVRRQLVVVGEKALGLSVVLEGVEKHRLPDAAESADDHALFGRFALQAPADDAELLDLGGAAGQLGWA